jgi:hypothetical protein
VVAHWSKELTKTETDELTLIRSQIFSTATPEEEVPNLYREAVAILHGAWCRTQKTRNACCETQLKRNQKWEWASTAFQKQHNKKQKNKRRKYPNKI